MCGLEEIYSRLCCTFRWCGRTVVEGGKARRSDRERGSLLSERASRRRALANPAFTCTHDKRAGVEGRSLGGFLGADTARRPERTVEGISRDCHREYIVSGRIHAQLREITILAQTSERSLQMFLNAAQTFSRNISVDVVQHERRTREVVRTSIFFFLLRLIYATNVKVLKS